MIYEYFAELSKIPRCSGDEKAASDFLAAFGRERGLEVYQDEALNVLIKKNGSGGRENEPPVILQAHIDMVCEKNAGVNHDFSKDPIIPVINGDWITAEKETTLGADDGSGISYIMAILASNDISHPPIEAVFTTVEETGMTGAESFDGALLLGRRFINIDSEEEGILTVSCAAGADVDIVVTVDYEPSPKNFEAYELMIGGLIGGHSGMDIHKGYANANLLMAELLNGFDEIDYRASSIDGGSRRNAIPRECTAVVLFDGKDINTIQSIIAQTETAFKSTYQSDPNLIITLKKTSTPESVIKKDHLKNMLGVILKSPNGVLMMCPGIDGLVQTSNNVGVVITNKEKGTITLSNFPRSSVASEQSQTINKLKSLAASINAVTEIANEKPAWSYNPNSPLREKMSAVFESIYGAPPVVRAVHAGLECGIFAQKLPNVDLISIGPNIHGAHSPNERMSLSSFNSVYQYLIKSLEVL